MSTVYYSSPELTLPLAPLVVDLDGTLTPTDTLYESALRLFKRNPLLLFFYLGWLIRGRAFLKNSIAERIDWSGENVPLNIDLCEYLLEQKKAGRQLFLATAANFRIAHAVAKRLGIFDGVIASNECINMKATAKLEAIRARVGTRFVYAGDSVADLPIWAASEKAIFIGRSKKLLREIQETTSVEKYFELNSVSPFIWLKALRVHQWLKNLLILVPLLTSFTLFDESRLSLILLAFFSFCFAASATYIANDLWDLDNDRAHPTKKLRPFASARISIPAAILAAFVLMVAAFSLAQFCNASFRWWLIAYIVLTSIYSWSLKRYVIADVLTLACLYTTRIIAGAAAIGITVSTWLLAFSGFLFFGLALVKRCAELVSMKQLGKIEASGRNYKVADLEILWSLGTSASLASVVVFGLYINSPETAIRYKNPQLIWLAALGMTYWLGRLWIKTVRGEMHDDPIVFTARDKNSLIVITLMVMIVLIAYFIKIDI